MAGFLFLVNLQVWSLLVSVINVSKIATRLWPRKIFIAKSLAHHSLNNLRKRGSLKSSCINSGEQENSETMMIPYTVGGGRFGRYLCIFEAMISVTRAEAPACVQTAIKDTVCRTSFNNTPNVLVQIGIKLLSAWHQTRTVSSPGHQWRRCTQTVISIPLSAFIIISSFV